MGRQDLMVPCGNLRKLRLHVVMKREVTFNALGFLNLDYTLVHSVIAAATTYLVILIQFTEETPSPTPPVRNLNYPY
nr:putative gustatory receptor 2a [Halyomorpha halys]